MATPKENIINAIKWLIPNLEKKFAAITHKHTKSEITDFPTSMPASDVYAWAKSSSKPSYTKSEVGLGNVDNTADSAKSVKYATSSGSAGSADKLSSSAGSATQPVYFSNGKPAVCSYTLGKSVPSDAKFTDTNTWRGIQDNLTSTSTTESLSANQGKLLKDSIDSLNSKIEGIICTVFDVTGAGNNYFYIHKKNGMCAISFTSTSDASVYTTGISCDNSSDYYTIRVSKNLASGTIYKFIIHWVKIGLNA